MLGSFLNALIFLSGICLLWFGLSDSWLALLEIIGLGDDLHRPRVYGDLAIIRRLTIIIAFVLIAFPALFWRYSDALATLAQKLRDLLSAASMTHLLIPILLTTLILVKTVLQLGLYVSGYAAYSADDFGRTLSADRWLHGDDMGWEGWLALGSPWLPFPNYLFGLALALYRDLYFTPKIVNLLLSATAVIVVYFLGRELFGRTVGVLTATLFALLPWNLWLGISGMTSDLPSAIMIALFGFFLFRWFETDRPEGLITASVCLLAANGMRYETWFFSVVFSLLLSVTMISRWGRARLTWRLAVFGVSALTIANAFPIIHLIASYVILGDFLPALQKTDSFKVVTQAVIPKINVLVLIVISFPFELALSVGGIALFVKSDRRKPCYLYLFILVATLLFFVFTFKGTLPSHGAGVSRVLLPYIILLLPFAGFLLARLLTTSAGTYHAALGCALLLVVLGFDVVRASNYRDTFPKDAINAGWTVRKLEELGTLPRNSRILLEKSEGKHWGHLGIMVVANRPERFVSLDTLHNSCRSGFQTEGCQASIREGNFKLAILWSQGRVMSFRGTFGGRFWEIGRYHIFEVKTQSG
jgi:Dolichyl-phosphate-mannose-protein mannosyltransferase